MSAHPDEETTVPIGTTEETPKATWRVVLNIATSGALEDGETDALLTFLEDTLTSKRVYGTFRTRTVVAEVERTS